MNDPEWDPLNRLLARAAHELEPVPPALIGRIEQRLRSARRRRLVLRIGGLAAAVLLAIGVAAWWLTRERPHDEPMPPVVAGLPPGPAPQEHTDPRSRVRVTFAPRAGVIDVPVKTTSPDVTIIWLYPTEPAGARVSSPLTDRSTP